ncbi:MAG: hypothetical protein WA183_08825 [Chthoniobacterales bacterium]
MKKRICEFAYFLLAGLASAATNEQDISLSNGRILHHARIATFSDGEFVIEHDSGIAHVARTEMPAAIRAQYPLDSKQGRKEEEVAQPVVVGNSTVPDPISSAAQQQRVGVGMDSQTPQPAKSAESIIHNLLGAFGVVGVGIAMAFLAFLIAITWLVFPFVIIGKCNAIIRELKEISGLPPGRRKTIEPQAITARLSSNPGTTWP